MEDNYPSYYIFSRTSNVGNDFCRLWNKAKKKALILI